MGKGMMEAVYYPYRMAERRITREMNHLHKDLKNLRAGLNFKSRERIGTYAIAQQGTRGLEQLASQGITEIPKLNTREMKAYNEIRSRLEDWHTRINEMRVENGLSPLPKLENYFTFVHTMTALEKTGLKTNYLLERADTIMNRYAKAKQSAFVFGKRRGVDPLGKMELDAINVYRRYASNAIKHVNYTPIVAQVREMLMRLKDGEVIEPKPTGGVKKTKKYYNFANENPRAAEFLREWSNYIADMGQYSKMNFGDRVLRRMSENIAISTLGANFRSALIQPTALRNTFAEVGLHTIEGVVRTLDPKATREVLRKSNVLESRAYEAIITDLMESLSHGRLAPAKQFAAKWSMAGLKWLDMRTAIATWEAGYRRAKSRRMSEKDAINYADDLVVRTQASALKGDISPIQRSAVGKFFTMFQTFVINDWGYLTKDVLGIRNKNVRKRDAMRNVVN
jgi:hypothetical protein